MSAVVFYISGHGFGHASRSIEIINALAGLRPDVRIHVRTSAPRWLFDLSVATPFEFSSQALDIGVVQIDALTPDIDATIRQASAFYDGSGPLIDSEARALTAIGARLVIADIPPLAFAAAARAGVPSIGISNFTWDWIYEDYARGLGIELPLVEQIRSWHRSAREAWRLPMCGGFAGFREQRDLPLVARRSRRDRRQTRGLLGWNDSRTVVLSSFGGVRQQVSLERLAHATNLRIIGTDTSQERSSGNRLLELAEHGDFQPTPHVLYENGLRYEDVVAAADVVVTKPGYGIVGECIANRTAMLYTGRGRFAEYQLLVDGIQRWLRARYADQADLTSGNWSGHIRELLAQPEPVEHPDVNGADLAARWMDELLRSV